jgi:hypothetical protein
MPQSGIFTSVRAAIEATRGTGVNPVRILEQTTFDHTPDVKTIRPMERRGSYFGFYRAAVGREKHTLSMGGNLSYNQLAWLGNMFFKGVTTGVGGGADKTYTFVPTSASDDLKAFTFEWGYDTTLSATQPGFRLPFVVGDQLTITFDKSADEGVTFAANMHSPKAISQLSAFGGSPAAIANTIAMTPVQTQVWIDPTTIGTTIDQYVSKAEFVLDHEWTDIDTLNTTTAAQDTFRVGARGWTLTLTRYGINDNELDRYYDKAVRKIRIKNTGAALGGSNYAATLDLYGVLDTDGHKHGETDGVIWETLKYVPVYDTTATTDHSLVVVTAETTIT